MLAFELFLAHCTVDKEVMKMKKKFEGKEEYLMRNGALLLEKQVASSEGKGIAIKIFTAEELNKATYNYDTSLIHSRILSTVYKGNLDGQLVAVKTPEGLQVSDFMLEYFLNQAVTQIQINHKHVVKLLGCCLETEIPILVQEFIPNGSLSNHIMRSSVPFSWSDRLRIANEIAGAVAYLHCVNSNPIIHRDIRSNNILFDQNYIAKLSNFGFSVVIPSGKTGTEFRVDGIFEYMDPEYIETSKLSEKCDVYSFGLMLLELLYWKIIKVYPFIVEHFITKMKDGYHGQILDGSFVGEQAQRQAYTTLASKCIKYKGEERPTMIEVAKELRRIRGIIP
ncbi:Wall-associated receptor kinase-like [Thalictrum thalictroides]|uniref:Wall-associated receptor kinase-like n=1 Tax=Thalictrum thalictroides TaxID=46969 RepID=A0A7J6V733_THATH|nr:Wall-associated receptor kinase-like [Thalictrum thalictroides]